MKWSSSLVFVATVFSTVLSSQTGVSSAEDETSDPDEVEETISEMENNIENLMDIITKQLTPHVFRVGFQSSASLKCLIELSSVVSSAKKLEAWAIRMVDATGKPSGGLMEGTSTALGDYDECLDVKSPAKFPTTGEYCLLEIKPPGSIVNAMKEYQVSKEKTNHTIANTKSFLGFLQKVRTNPDHVVFRLGICMPSSCSVKGIQSMINLATENVDVPIEVVRCKSKEGFHFESDQILIITIIALFMVIVAFGTVISIVRTRDDISPPDSSDSKREDSSTENRKTRHEIFLQKIDFLSRFSLCEGANKLLKCDPEGDSMDVIRGMKLFTILFAIFAHTYALPHPLHLYRFRNTLNFTKFIDEVLFGAIANSSVGVDTFFFIAGFYFIYNRWRLIKKPNICTYILKFICIMFIRMIAIQILVGSLLFLMPVFGSGPLWEEFVEGPIDNCRKTWWMNLLFIQNFLGPYDYCLYPTWILATMMQIFLITAVTVYILHRWPMYGILCLLFIIILGMLGVAIVTGIAGYPATFTIYFYDYRTSIYFWKHLYTQFYTHIGPQCIGMLTAYFIAEYPLRKLDKRFQVPLWIICFSTLSSIVFGLHHYRDGQEMSRGLAVFYAAVHRPAWAIALSWIVYACSTGQGGSINSLLTLKALIPMERLSYFAYMLHIPLMYYQGGMQRERIFMGHYNQIMCFLSYTVATYVLAFICYLLFQVPYEVLESWIFRKNHGNVWGANPITVSQVTLKSNDEEKAPNEEEHRPRVLINRYIATERF